MNQAFDPFNLILLAIALIIFWRLRSVLGSRTGNERPPFDPYAATRPEKPSAPEAANGNVIRLPKDSDAAARGNGDGTDQPPIWKGWAEETSPVAKGFEQLAAADPTFNPKSFLEGGKLAYEMILDAFAKGDRAALKSLLTKDVYEGFAADIAAREAAGQRREQHFVGIDKAEYQAVDLVGRKARITVRFLSQLISATLNSDGTVVEGDPRQIRELTDVWTFERDVTSRDPNWKLAATEDVA